MPTIEEIPLSISPVEASELFVYSLNSFFLDSGMDYGKLGRYSFIGAEPFLIFRSKGEAIEIIENEKLTQVISNPFDILKDLLSEYKLDFRCGPFPFIGGAVGYFSYDLGQFIEELPDWAIDDIDVWDCYLGFYDTVIMFDNLESKAYLISFPFRGERRTRKTMKLFRDRLCAKKKDDNPGAAVAEEVEREEIIITSNFTKENYLKAIERAKEYIAAGDIYQVNLSQRLSTNLYIHPWDLYKRLRAFNPAPFAAYLNFDGITVVSASPERFLKVNGRRIETRPIKGTRPRGKNLAEDRLLAQELLASEKDKAEHVMIVDLERNDLGKICEYGSVRVSEFEILETYATVFHLVSTVEGQLRPDVDWIDCLRACFPGGSITGAPKIRAMEIIEELEPTKRSVYTGSIGYLSFNGNMDLSIVIRTFIIKPTGQGVEAEADWDRKAYFQVGGGIVADSEPEKEYDETMDKAKALVEALQRPRVS